MNETEQLESTSKFEKMESLDLRKFHGYELLQTIWKLTLMISLKFLPEFDSLSWRLLKDIMIYDSSYCICKIAPRKLVMYSIIKEIRQGVRKLHISWETN